MNRKTESLGIFKRTGKAAGVLRDLSRPGLCREDDVMVSPELVRKYGLVEGAAVRGSLHQNKSKKTLQTVDAINGLAPDVFMRRVPFTRLTAIDPSERFNLAAAGQMSMRVIELVAPMGKGTRGLIVSPPKAGKTTILEQIAEGIAAGHPDVRVVAVLIDERPEEVTHFRRAIKAEVIASSSDQAINAQIEMAELMLAHIRVELECGRDIVVLVDSLTRMGRVFNQKSRGRGRTLSGGLDAGALEIPRRFFGLARNIEGGGSVTIIATALIDTGSRMDQLIFEEFKGTGNCELVLDRAIAEARIFPAVNIAASGTRKEEHLYDSDEIRQLAVMRRVLVERNPKDAMAALLSALEKYPTNQEFLTAVEEGLASG